MTETEIKEALRGHPSIIGISVIPKNGNIRIDTSFLYLDGHSVILLLINDNGTFSGKLSDCGNTCAKIEEYQIDYTKHLKIIDRIASIFEVSRDQDELYLVSKTLEKLSNDIVLLGQACMLVCEHVCI